MKVHGKTVCVCERERDRQTDREKRERDREREISVCDIGSVWSVCVRERES